MMFTKGISAARTTCLRSDSTACGVSRMWARVRVAQACEGGAVPLRYCWRLGGSRGRKASVWKRLAWSSMTRAPSRCAAPVTQQVLPDRMWQDRQHRQDGSLCLIQKRDWIMNPTSSLYRWESASPCSEGSHGSTTDSSGVLQVDDRSRSVSVNSIWGIGDVTSRIPLTPVARMEGTQLALHLFGWGAVALIVAALSAHACFLPEAFFEALRLVLSLVNAPQDLLSIC